MKLSLAAARAFLWRSALFTGLWWALTDGHADSWGWAASAFSRR